MKAARLFGPKDLRIVDLPIPQLGAGDVLCKVRRACICGTDLAIFSGNCSFVRSGEVDFPMTQGHEWSGVVAATGSGVTRFHPGDHVVSTNGISCGKCPECLVGNLARCKNSRSLGTVHAWDGAFAEYVRIPERNLFLLPDKLSFEEGALLEPATVAYSGILAANVHAGDTVLIHGSGPIGIITAKLAKTVGASKIFLTGRKAYKLNKGKEFGADITINTTAESVSDVLARETIDGKVDRIIETSGAIELLQDSFLRISGGGTIAVLAFYEHPLPELAIDQIVFRNISLKGVADASRTHIPILRLMETGNLCLSPLISGRYGFENILDAYRDMADGGETRIKMILDFE